MRLSRAILIFLIVGLIGQGFYYYPNLPEMMASHFNEAGEPNSWMPKQNFFIVLGTIFFLITALFTSLPLLLEKIPAELINIPNKEHWLSNENRTRTFAIIRQYFEWFAVGLLGLFIAVNELVFRANLAHQNLSNAAWIVLVIYLIFVVIWLSKFILQFRKT